MINDQTVFDEHGNIVIGDTDPILAQQPLPLNSIVNHPLIKTLGQFQQSAESFRSGLNGLNQTNSNLGIFALLLGAGAYLYLTKDKHGNR